MNKVTISRPRRTDETKTIRNKTVGKQIETIYKSLLKRYPYQHESIHKFIVSVLGANDDQKFYIMLDKLMSDRKYLHHSYRRFAKQRYIREDKRTEIQDQHISKALLSIMLCKVDKKDMDELVLRRAVENQLVSGEVKTYSNEQKYEVAVKIAELGIPFNSQHELCCVLGINPCTFSVGIKKYVREKYGDVAKR